RSFRPCLRSFSCCSVCFCLFYLFFLFFFFQAEDGIRDDLVTGVQTCALPISLAWHFPFSSAAAQQITSETLELRGRVINSATGEPVALALVQVSAPGPKTQFTGADGTFVFTGLPPGNYWPLARKPGFFDDSEPQRPDPAPLLSSGQHEPIILKLLPEAI